MKQVLTIIIGLMAILGNSIPMKADNSEKLLQLLDSTIAQRSQFVNDKEKRIEELKRTLGSVRADQERLRLLEDLYDEYYVFRSDSAFKYLKQGYDLAVCTGNRHYQNLFQLNCTELFSITGLYSEALDILNRLHPEEMDSTELLTYHINSFTLYSYKSTFTSDSIYSPLYTAKAIEHLKKAICYLDEDNPNYYYYMAENSRYVDDNHDAARNFYQQVILKDGDTSRLSARAHFALAHYFKNHDDDPGYREHMIKSALCDMRSVTMEHTALQQVAMFLFEQGEENLERAEHYINVSMVDAKFYNNRLRIIQISQVMPQIVAAYQTTIKKQNSRLSYALLFISLLVIGLMVTAFFIHRQNRLLSARRRELAKSNEQLHALNGQLHDLNSQLHEANGMLEDTNRKREGLASIYIDLCAKYIDKLGKYKTLVKRKIKANQAQELLQTISSTRISEEDASTFLSRFDKAFLELYPTFIQEFNALLQEDSRIQQKSSTSMTTELRTFALIRLGVKNTADIAGLLFLSTQTVYNCRSLIKNHALNKDTFDADVMNLCTVIRP